MVQFVTDTFACVGSAMTMGPSVAALFTQLGIWDEFVDRSKVCHTGHMYTEDLKLINTITFPWLEEAYVIVAQVPSS